MICIVLEGATACEALRRADHVGTTPHRYRAMVTLVAAEPQLYVRDVDASCAF